MYNIQRRFPSCEHNVKRIRTCKTSVTKYPVIFSVEVPSLLELCARKVSQKLPVNKIFKDYLQKNTFSLNNKIADLLLHYLTDDQIIDLLSSDDSFLCSPGLCHLNELCLSKRKIDGLIPENAMEYLSHNRLDALSLSESDLTQTTLNHLAATQQDLLHLDISYCLCMEVFDSVFAFKSLTYLNLEKTNFKLNPASAHQFFMLKNLRWLGLSKLKKHTQESKLSLQLLTSVTSQLSGLDLSETCWDMTQHHKFTHFKCLEYLDISHYPEGPGQDRSAVRFDDIIANTLSTMKTLKSLDISGCHIHQQESIYKLRDLKLDFLGIVAQDDLYFIQDIDSLAVKVASHRKLEHILVLLNKYKNNVAVLEQALKNLFTLHRNRVDLGYSSAHIEPQLFEVVLNTLERYPAGEQIQHVAAACLYTLNSDNDMSTLASEPYPGYDRHVRKGIILLVRSIHTHNSQFDVLKNCMGMLSQFGAYLKEFMFYEIVHSYIYVLERQKSILERSRVLSMEDLSRDKANKISTLTVKAINTSICQSACGKKNTVGKMRLIETILEISRLGFSMFKMSPHEPNGINFCDLLLETWSTLWNITDEQAGNCDRFVSHGGLDLYLDTYYVCSQVRTEDSTVTKRITTLIRNMLGLMGNIAEVSHIRPKLQESEDMIRSFYMLRSYNRDSDSECDIIEIRYSAAGILSHICSDGPDKWQAGDDELSYDIVLKGIEEAVDSWNINSKRSINYKSFNPILHILKVDCPYPCKLWAVWALANLCQTKPFRFVPMLRRDGGVELLNKLKDSPGCPDNIKHLSTITIMKAYDPNIGPEIEET